MASTFTCDVCKKALAPSEGFEVIRTAFARDMSDGDADAVNETVHACGAEHFEQLAPEALTSRFTADGKKKRGLVTPASP